MKKKCIGKECTFPHGRAELKNWKMELHKLQHSPQVNIEGILISSPPHPPPQEDIKGEVISSPPVAKKRRQQIKLGCSLSCLILLGQVFGCAKYDALFKRFLGNDKVRLSFLAVKCTSSVQLNEHMNPVNT